MIRYRHVLMATVATAALALAACGGGDGGSGGGSDGKPVTVKVGVLPISNTAPLYIGMDEGFFREEKIKIEPVQVQSGSEVVAGIVSGNMQFGFLGYVPVFSGRSRNLPLKLVTNADNGAVTSDKEWTQLVVPKDSPIRDVQDLEGKTIAVNALKGVGEVAIKAALDKRGVDPDSIKLLEVPFPDMPAVLDSGRVDAIWAPEPFLTSVLGKGARAVEAPLTTLGERFPNGGYATSEQYLAKNRDVVERFARAMKKSSKYATDNPDEARAKIPEFTQIPPAVARKIRIPLWPTEFDREQMQELIDYSAKYKVIDKKPSLDDLIVEGES